MAALGHPIVGDLFYGRGALETTGLAQAQVTTGRIFCSQTKVAAHWLLSPQLVPAAMDCKHVRRSVAQQLHLRPCRQLLQGRVRDCCSTHKSSALYTPPVVTDGPMLHHVRLCDSL
jgi:hypothetical protein